MRDWVPGSELVRRGWLIVSGRPRRCPRHQALVERALGEYEVDTVFHLAAQAVVGIASRNPVSTLDTNIRGTWAVARSRADGAPPSANHRRLVRQGIRLAPNASVSEDMPLQGRYPYDASKSCADLIAQSYAVTYAPARRVTRCANLYGGGDMNWNRLVPGTIRSALRGERPVIRSDGQPSSAITCTFKTVCGLSHARRSARPRPRTGRGQAFNFGHAEPIGVLALVNKILAIAHRTDLLPDIRGDANHEIPDQYLDPTRAHRVLGWRAQFDHPTGLSLALAWYREFLGATA